jgi:hypothetical protein
MEVSALLGCVLEARERRAVERGLARTRTDPSWP